MWQCSTFHRLVILLVGLTLSRDMCSEKGPQSLGAAVSMILGDTARGVMRFVQVDPDTCVMEGTIDGLSPGAHGLFIHELGDVSRGCARFVSTVTLPLSIVLCSWLPIIWTDKMHFGWVEMSLDGYKIMSLSVICCSSGFQNIVKYISKL